VVAAGGEIMRHCVDVGGALTGEHGIGMEKNELMPLIFTPDDLALMERVRSSFNPDGRLNPGKVLPMGKGCGEIRVPKSPASAAIST
jgi:glycolate oxidase